MTWYVAPRGGLVATDTSEAYGVFVLTRLGGLCEAVSIGAELVVVASPVGVSVLAKLGELCETTLTGGGLVVVASSAGVSLAARSGELCKATSTGAELVGVAPAVVGVGDFATDRFFG